MKRILCAAFACLLLSACNEERRSHERQMDQQNHRQTVEMQQLEHQQQLRFQDAQLRSDREVAKIQAAHDAEVSIKYGEIFEILAKVLILAGTAGGIVLIVFRFADQRNRHIRDVQIVEKQEGTKRFRYAVDAIKDPNNGLSPEQRTKGLAAALAHTGTRSLTHRGQSGGSEFGRAA